MLGTLWNWLRAGMNAIAAGAIRLQRVVTLRRFAITYLIWLALSLALFIGIGHYFNLIWAALVLWVGIGALAPLLILPPAKRLIFAVLGIVFAGVILRMTGIDSRFITAIVILILGMAFIDSVPIPARVRTGIRSGLAISLVVIPLLGGIYRTLPSTATAVGTIRPTLDQWIADLLGGGPLFDPVTGEPRAKYNPETGEIFSGDRSQFSYDPRTGTKLETLTREKLKELKRKRSAPTPSPAKPRAEKTSAGGTSYSRSEPEVQAFVRGWVEAWEARDLERYMAHYATDFEGVNYSKGTGFRTLSYVQWKADKQVKFDRANWIRVELTNLHIEVAGAQAKVTFAQRYRSNVYEDKGTKTLILKRDLDRLLIVREEFRL